MQSKLIEEEKEPKAKTDLASSSANQGNYNTMIPGFSMFRNRIITPLLIASEKVVEYMIPASKDSSKTKEGDAAELNKEDQNINDKFSKMSLEDIERHNRKRTMTSLSKTDKPVNISKNLMNKASD